MHSVRKIAEILNTVKPLNDGHAKCWVLPSSGRFCLER